MEIKRMLELIIDAAKNDDMNRIIELAENQQDKFCDNNCVWTDHHKDCVRAEQKPVVEVRLVAGGKPMFLMCVLPESFKDGDSLYTTPQQRNPLTDEQIGTIAKEHIAVGTRSFEEFARRIEAAHGIKE